MDTMIQTAIKQLRQGKIYILPEHWYWKQLTDIAATGCIDRRTVDSNNKQLYRAKTIIGRKENKIVINSILLCDNSSLFGDYRIITSIKTPDCTLKTGVDMRMCKLCLEAANSAKTRFCPIESLAIWLIEALNATKCKAFKRYLGLYITILEWADRYAQDSKDVAQRIECSIPL